MMHNPPHPGEILREYIDGLNKTVTEVAVGLGSRRKHLKRAYQYKRRNVFETLGGI